MKNTIEFKIQFTKPLDHKTFKEMDVSLMQHLKDEGFSLAYTDCELPKNNEGKYTGANYEIRFAHDMDRPMRNDVERAIYEAFKKEGFYWRAGVEWS